MIRQVLLELRPFLPPRHRLLGCLLVAESLFVGLLEASLLVLIVASALAVADQSSFVTVSAPALGDLNPTLGTALIIAAIAGLAVTLTHLHVARLTANISALVLHATRQRCIAAFASASWSRQSRDREGALQETMGNLAAHTATLVLYVSSAAVSLVGLLALLAVALLVDPVVTLVVLLFGGGLFLALRPFGRATRKFARFYVDAHTDFAEAISQWSTLSMELRVFGVEVQEAARLEKASEHTSRAFARSRLMTRIASSLYRDVAVVFLVLAVGILSLGSGVHLGSIGAVILLIVRSLAYAQTVNAAVQSIYEQGPNLFVLLERTRSLEADAEVFGTRAIGAITSVEFARVGYDYAPGRPGIENVDFRIDAGEAIGVIGPSGGGKSTLVQVLLRLRPPTRGSVIVSGVPYQEIEPTSWHRLVALVSQEPKLFQGTVADNITFLRSGFSPEAIEASAASAHVRDDILQLPGGFSAQLGPRGAGLSGGQKQRVAIARALIGRPELLVLDEPTSALDLRSEQLFRETIEELKGRVTLVIIAHRINTLSCCDRVVAMREGKVEIIGSLNEALAQLSFVDELLE